MSQGDLNPPKDFGAFRASLIQRFESLSPHLKRVARYALGEPNRLALQTVAQVATETRVQPSTLIRFAKAFGFSGYTELQQLLRGRLLDIDRSLRERGRGHRNAIDQAKGADVGAILHAVCDASVLGIEHLKSHVEPGTLRQAVDMLDAAGTVHLIAQAHAWPVATCLAHGLVELEKPCVLLERDAWTTSRQLAGVRPGDVLLATGFGEDVRPLVEAAATVRARRIPVIAITDSDFSPLARESDTSFLIGDAIIQPIPPLGPYMVLAQSLIIARGHRKHGI